MEHLIKGYDWSRQLAFVSFYDTQVMMTFEVFGVWPSVALKAHEYHLLLQVIK
jgi:hypothetical protein